MRTVNDNYIDLALGESRQPVHVVKILNSTQTIYFTTDTVAITDAGALFKQRSIKASAFAGQKIKPEAAISSIGSMNLEVDDTGRELTDALTAIDQAGGSLFNDKVEIYSGFKELDFSDYIQITPLYVKSFKPTEISYQFEFTDIQRITKKSIFVDPKKTELVGNYSFSDAGTIEVISTTGFETVSHDADWYVDPSLTVGYIKVKGINSEGREAKEIISYTGKTATEFTGCQRARMGTERINLSAQDENNNPQELEITEVIYIDLPQPAMVLALLTGDLYGQVGQSLPDHWHAGLDGSMINTPSFVNINGANWNERIEFRDTETQDAKDFIAEQCLAPYGTLLRVDQTGQYELAKFDYVNQQSSADLVLTYDQLISQGQSTRSAKDIKNNFLFNWGWRVDGEYYARKDFYPDTVSQQKHKFTSELVEIELLGLRNRDKNSKTTLDFVAQSMVKRLSNPAIRRTVTVDMGFVIDREVGDLISLRADNEPDYRTGGVYQETFEIQGVSFDFLEHTATLQLFASEGTPTDFNVDTGNNTTSIGRAGWTNLATSGYGTESGGVFTFNDGANIADGKYYYDGDIRLNNTHTITINGSVYFDYDNLDLRPDTFIDGVGRGKLEAGYFGLGNTAQSGFEPNGPKPPASQVWATRTIVDYLNNQDSTTDGLTSVKLDDVIRVEDGQQIDSVIPAKLFGTYGPSGGDSFGVIEVSESNYDIRTIAGGAEVRGGAGLFLCGNSITVASSARIDVSGASNNIGGVGDSYFNGGDEGEWQNTFSAGSSGFGWNGVVIVALKDKNAARPLLSDLVIAKSGAAAYNDFIGGGFGLFKRGSNRNYLTRFNPAEYMCSVPESSTFADTDYASSENQSAIKIIYLVTAGDTVSDPVLDPIEAAPTPIVAIVRNMNTPETAQGDQVTYELTATPNDATEYVQFEYSVSGSAYNPCLYVTSTESNLTLTATGETVKIRATAFNKASKAGGSSITNITLPLVERDSSTSLGGSTEAPKEITLPKIRGLELVNRISNDDWNEFKSGNAEFRWLKMSNTLPSNLDNLNGATDLHLEGYKVRITNTAGQIVREEVVKDSFFVYTYDKNKFDNGTPIRSFKIEVQAVSTTGYVSPFAGFTVENPAPSAPSAVVASAGFSTIEIIFQLPTDVDFVGVDAYIMNGTGDPYTAGDVKRVSGNTVVFDGLVAGNTYTYGLRSVDQFGTGGQITATGIQTRLIESSELGDITTPVVIDEDGGRLITNNSGYVAFHGATTAAGESPNPLIFGAFDSGNYPFWIDTAGNGKFGKLSLSASGAISSPQFTIDEDGIMNINMVSAAAAIAVGSAVFGASGCQIENNNDNPRLYIGAGEADNGIQYEDSKLNIGRNVNFDGVDSYESDYLYRSLRSHTEFTEEATVTTVTANPYNGNRATNIKLDTASTSGGLVDRVELLPETKVSFGRVDFDKPTRLKVKLNPIGATTNDDIFAIGVGQTTTNNQGRIVVQFVANGTAGRYNVRTLVTSPDSSYVIAPDTGFPAGSYSGEVLNVDMFGGDPTGSSKVEIVYIPNVDPLYAQIRIFINDVEYDELGYSATGGFNSGFRFNMPTNPSGPNIYNTPYFTLTIASNGAATRSDYVVGGVKFMNGET